MRKTASSGGSAAQTAVGPKAIARTSRPTWTVAVTAFCAGSIRDTVPSAPFATQTPSRPKAIPLGPLPTPIAFRTLPEPHRGARRCPVVRDPEGGRSRARARSGSSPTGIVRLPPLPLLDRFATPSRQRCWLPRPRHRRQRLIRAVPDRDGLDDLAEIGVDLGHGSARAVGHPDRAVAPGDAWGPTSNVDRLTTERVVGSIRETVSSLPLVIQIAPPNAATPSGRVPTATLPRTVPPRASIRPAEFAWIAPRLCPWRA